MANLLSPMSEVAGKLAIEAAGIAARLAGYTCPVTPL
ncbi:alanine dehydrogenase [Bradyrhizobium sp. USDA 10063]